MKKRTLCLISGLLLSGTGLAQNATVDLGTLGGRTSIARDINQSGVIVGEAETAEFETHAFLWTDGIMTDLGVLNGKYSMANGLNNKNQVVGYAAKRGGGAAVGTDAVLWDLGKIVKLPPYKAAPFSQASEINDKEEIVGVSGMNAVVWRKRKPTALPSLGGSYAIALAINNKGWIIGNSATIKEHTHATIWKNDKPMDLGTLGGRFSNANGINDEGVVVGSSEMEDGSIHGFVWKDGVMRDIGPGMPRAINNKGSITGERNREDRELSDPVAFLIDASGSDLALNLIAVDTYSSGFSINDAGIADGVTAIKDNEGYARFHAVLWK